MNAKKNSPRVEKNNPFPNHLSPKDLPKKTTGWWLNQPIWKIWPSNWIIFPQGSGWKLQIFELPPPRTPCLTTPAKRENSPQSHGETETTAVPEIPPAPHHVHLWLYSGPGTRLPLKKRGCLDFTKNGVKWFHLISWRMGSQDLFCSVVRAAPMKIYIIMPFGRKITQLGDLRSSWSLTTY